MVLLLLCINEFHLPLLPGCEPLPAVRRHQCRSGDHCRAHVHNTLPRPALPTASPHSASASAGYVGLARAVLRSYQRLAQSTVEDIEDPRGIEAHCV